MTDQTKIMNLSNALPAKPEGSVLYNQQVEEKASGVCPLVYHPENSGVQVRGVEFAEGIYTLSLSCLPRFLKQLREKGNHLNVLDLFFRHFIHGGFD